MKPSPGGILEKGVWAVVPSEKAKDFSWFSWQAIFSIMIFHFEKTARALPRTLVSFEISGN